MKIELNERSPYLFEIPKQDAMNVPALVYASKEMVDAIRHEEGLRQLIHMSQLPGIVKAAMAMPDIHSGYGFPIGGVAAFDWQNGIISPGGVGYDINCGVRLIRTLLEKKDIDLHLESIINRLFQEIPSGAGGKKKKLRADLKGVISQGSQWAVKKGYGEQRDILFTEDNGCMPFADIEHISKRALERGQHQLCTLGGGNHFLEIDVVDEIFDAPVARTFGLFEQQIAVLLHTGSRGLGYQICEDYLKAMQKDNATNQRSLPNSQLACMDILSPKGQAYYSAMSGAANFAWANRQMMTHYVREVFQAALNISPRDLGMDLVYDLSHNVARKEQHMVEGKKQTLCVHRKGATRAFGPGHHSLPLEYQQTGQPVIVPGDMGTASYVLCGTQKAMEETFGSACHGAGRVLSRSAAKKAARGRSIADELQEKGIMIRYRGRSTLAEEMPDAYKNISDVVEVICQAGIAKKVARLRPLGVIKG
ncbi:MAG: RtcB family protein [Candidatus Magnetomorum sp.]|nr:RtcB family protein [Candidatus Magnetomorum sp.]